MQGDASSARRKALKPNRRANVTAFASGLGSRWSSTKAHFVA